MLSTGLLLGISRYLETKINVIKITKKLLENQSDFDLKNLP